MTEALFNSKVPPFSKETEMVLLSAMIQDPSMAVNEVTASAHEQHFYLEKHKKIFQGILSLFESTGGAIDLVGLSEIFQRNNELEFIGGTAYLAELLAFPPITIGLDYYIDRLKQYYYLRKILATCTSIIDRGYQVKDNIGDFISEAERAFLEISNEQNKKGLTPVEEVLKESLKKLEQFYQQKKEITGVPSGIYDLDKITAGFQPSDLIILAARPAMGKTALALNIASFAALKENRVVVIFSLEMAKDQLMMRMLASEAKVSASNLRRGRLEDSDWAKLTLATEKVHKAPIFIDDSTDITATEIRSKCRRLKAEQGALDMVIIDYLQLIMGDNRRNNDSREREISEISRGMKALAKELNCPVIALAQLNRLLESRPDKRPKPSDLRESGSIEQDADVVMFIYREDYYKQDSDRKNIADIIIAKHRNGPTGKIELYFDMAKASFNNFEKTEYEAPPTF